MPQQLIIVQDADTVQLLMEIIIAWKSIANVVWVIIESIKFIHLAVNNKL